MSGEDIVSLINETEYHLGQARSALRNLGYALGELEENLEQMREVKENRQLKPASEEEIRKILEEPPEVGAKTVREEREHKEYLEYEEWMGHFENNVQKLKKEVKQAGKEGRNANDLRLHLIYEAVLYTTLRNGSQVSESIDALLKCRDTVNHPRVLYIFTKRRTVNPRTREMVIPDAILIRNFEFVRDKKTAEQLKRGVINYARLHYDGLATKQLRGSYIRHWLEEGITPSAITEKLCLAHDGRIEEYLDGLLEERGWTKEGEGVALIGEEDGHFSERQYNEMMKMLEGEPEPERTLEEKKKEKTEPEQEITDEELDELIKEVKEGEKYEVGV